MILTGLVPHAVREMLVERLEHEPDEATLERVHHITGGNQFFVIELAQLLAANAWLSGQLLPPAAQEVLRERLAPLSADSFRALEAASVLGHEFELELLAVALAQSVEALLMTSDEPIRLGLVHAVPGALRRYAFTHALVRETLYSGISPPVRSAIHLALARALEVAGAARDERLAALAHHYFEAARTSDPSQAIRYGCEAGERAQRSLAYDEAIRCFEQVLAALDLRTDDSTANTRARLRARVGLGEALFGAGEGEVDRAETVFRDAATLARTLGPVEFADAVLRWSLMRTEVGVPNVELNALLERALAALSGGASGLRARVMARLSAGLHVQPGSEKRRQELAEAAITMAHSLDDPETLVFVRARALIGLLGPDNLEHRLSATDEILRSAGSGETAALDALLLRMGDLAESGNRGGLDQAFVAPEQETRASGRPLFVWSTTVAKSGLALLEGRFEPAERLSADGLALGQKVEPQAAVLRYVQQLYPLRAWRGRVDEIVPLIEQSVAQIAIPAWRAALAYAYDISGRRTKARRELDALAADDFAAFPRDTTWLSGMALLANLCGRLEDRSRARVLYGLLLPNRDRTAVNRPLVIAVAPVSMCLGVLAAVGGQYEAADAHFAEALPLSERMRALPWQAEILFQWSRMLAQRGTPADFDRASRLLQQAETAGAAVGMTLLLDWIAESRRAARTVAADGATARRRDGEHRHAVNEYRTGGRSARGPLSARARCVDPRLRRAYHATSKHGRVGASGRAPCQAGARDSRDRPDRGRPCDGARTRHPPCLRGRRRWQPPRCARPDRVRGTTPGGARGARGCATPKRSGSKSALNEEIDFLTAELARGYGLGGRPRRAASTSERARISVSRAIKYAIDKIEAHDPALADHLRRSVRTGSSCVYAPAKRECIAWTF